MKMRSTVLLIMWFTIGIPSLIAKEARYAVPIISGTGVITEQREVGGLTLSVKTISLNSERPSSYMRLTWKQNPIQDFGKVHRFRLSLASELRTFQEAEVSLLDGEIIGTLDLSMGTVFQLYELVIPNEKLASVLKNGVEIRIKGEGNDVSFFIPDSDIPDSLAPHLLIPGTLSPREEFFKRFSSRAGYCSYGWEGGCVLDGLAALGERSEGMFSNSLKDLLFLYYPNNGSVKSYTSAENTSCLAQLANFQPHHPNIENVLDFWKSRMNDQGIILDYSQVAAEINYTAAWPLAVISKQLKSSEYAHMAWQQLRSRSKYLVDEDGAIWLRYALNEKSTQRTYKLWSRGLAWYFLGMAKTMDCLGNPPDDITKSFQDAADYLVSLQDEEGMWHMFADDTSTVAESSGTAGIATALAIGVRQGWLAPEMKNATNKAIKALDKRLTPDGFLTNVAHRNRAEGGEKFQRETQGGILQFGMGFYAQLLAELEYSDK